MIEEYVKAVRNDKNVAKKNLQSIFKEAARINKQYNFFNNFSEDLAYSLLDKNLSGKLVGVPVSAKDCICIQNVETTAGSAILKGYKPLRNATVINKIISQGAIPIGKTSQDEFGFGSFNVNIGLGFKVPKNPYDKKRVCGGSSGGAAGFTSITQLPHIALAESTGGSIAVPASYCGVVGFTPSYGVVSRYGLIDYANSLDKIGTIAKDVDDAFVLFSVIHGKDEKDSTSVNTPLKNKSIKKIGVIKEFLPKDPSLKDLILKRLEDYNYEYVSLPFTTKYSVATYYIIAMSEASTNLAKYCGLRYGLQMKLDKHYKTYFSKIRSKGFGKEAKRRILLGTFARMSGYRDAYYLQALKIRRLIIDEYKRLFKKYDVLVSPTTPDIAPTFDEAKSLTPLQVYEGDILTLGVNLAGLPHISVPAGYHKKMPYGCMFMADHFYDYTLSTLR